jgi:hypothetical protein
VVEARRSRITDDLIKRILDYQSELLDKNDFSRHTVAEARPRLKQNHIEAHDANEHQVTAENRNDQFDSGLDEDTNAEAILEEYQREKGNESSLTSYADHEAIWEDYRQAILDEQRRKEEDESDFYGYTDPKTAWEDHLREMENEKFLAHVQKFRDVLRKDGSDAAGAYLEREIKAEEEAKKNKARWDGIIKIAGVVLVTAFVMSKCSESDKGNDCYYEYGKYGAERICE